jgi:hypothetical protein
MSDNIFIDKLHKPTEKDLSEKLGAAYKYWEEIKKSLGDEYGDLVEEWKYYGQKYGWSLKLFYKKRNLFFFAVYKKYFRIGFTFGDKAVSAIEKSDLPKSLIEELKNAKKYVEGRGLRIEVKKQNDVKNIIKLVGFKINN